MRNYECPTCNTYIYKCITCNKKISREETPRAKKYCSRACMFIGRRNGTYIKCLHCVKDIYVAKWEKKTKKYCSIKCKAEYTSK